MKPVSHEIIIQSDAVIRSHQPASESAMLFLRDEGVVALMEDFRAMQQLYQSAIKEITTKLEILDEEFQIRHDHNPIHNIESRLKTPQSIADKLERLGYPLSVNSAKQRLRDIAGVRVICNYVDDIYRLVRMIQKQDDLTTICTKDYIANPKPNGYRSYHLILSVPVFLADHTEKVPVELQLRTVAMDSWASLEHHIRYKSSTNATQALQRRLAKNADVLAAIDADMQEIYQTINRLE